jgi:hypothetical protein
MPASAIRGSCMLHVVRPASAAAAARPSRHALAIAYALCPTWLG